MKNFEQIKPEEIDDSENNGFEQEKDTELIEEQKGEITTEVDLEEASDMEVAMFWAYHIDNPCEAEVEPGKKINIRDFYLRESKKILPNLKEDHARKFLEMKIQQYEKE